MPKIKLTKGELKKQRDNLRQYYRYLPTLQLKKQQLQLEIVRQIHSLEDRRAIERQKTHDALAWAGLLTDRSIDIRQYLKPDEVFTSLKNIAGVDMPLFDRVKFGPSDYDLFIVPLWVDAAIDALRSIVSLRLEIGVLEKGINILRHELRITTQRLNLFEKVKIPDTESAIKRIKIYIGDQMANAVGRGKIAKRKIEAVLAGESAP